MGELLRASLSCAVGLSLAVSACSVDTELGVAADIESASVTVMGTGADAEASVSLVVDFRVGDNALGARTFQVPRADLFVGGTPAGTINLDRPVGFDGTLAPGERERVTLMGATRNPDADTTLCAGMPVTVLVSYEHRDAMDGTALPDMDTSELETTDVTCR